MSEIVVETTPSETVIEIEGGPTLTTTVMQELQTLIETPAEPVVIDLNSGARGEPGSAILTGEAYPTLLMGSVGDIFIVTQGDVGVGDVYTKTVLGWVLGGNIRGATGGIESVNNQFGPVVILDKDDVGLANVDNTSDLNKPVSTAQQAALDALEDSVSSDFTTQLGVLSDEVDTKQDFIVAGETTQYWRGDKSWQILDKAAVGLANVDNTSDAAKPVSTAQQSALDLKANIESPTFTGTVGGISKAMVGLGNVDNTSDANKPVSTAQAASIATKVGLTGDESIAGTKTFTGIIFVPAPTEDLHASTKKYVDDRVNALIDTSPETLNTLNELAAALGDDPNFATTVTNQIATKVGLSGDESISGIKTFVSSPVVPDNSWAISKTVGLQAALDLKAPLASPTFTGTVTAPTFSGALAATNLTGTIDVARMPSTVVLTTGTQTITGPKSFSSFITVTGINKSIFTNDTSGYTSASTQLEVRSANSPGVYFHKPSVIDGILRILDTGRLIWANSAGTALQTAGIEAALFTGSGAGLTDLNGTNIATGTVAIPRLPASVVHRVVHNGTSWPARPTGATYVEWVGPTAPGSATSNDTWVNTSV